MQVNKDENSGRINQEIYATSFPKMSSNQLVGLYKVHKHIHYDMVHVSEGIFCEEKTTPLHNFAIFLPVILCSVE